MPWQLLCLLWLSTHARLLRVRQHFIDQRWECYHTLVEFNYAELHRPINNWGELLLIWYWFKARYIQDAIVFASNLNRAHANYLRNSTGNRTDLEYQTVAYRDALINTCKLFHTSLIDLRCLPLRRRSTTGIRPNRVGVERASIIRRISNRVYFSWDISLSQQATSVVRVVPICGKTWSFNYRE
jgi:hypothetical protein